MDNKNKTIPINKLKAECDREYQVRRFGQGHDWQYLSGLPIHRDDCYLFILLEHGFGTMNVDFKEIRLEESGLCIVRPGQIHHSIKGENASGWILQISSCCISNDIHNMLEDILLQGNAFPVPEQMLDDCVPILRILDKCSTEMAGMPLRGKATSALLETFLCFAVSACTSGLLPTASNQPRHEQICAGFRKLLAGNAVLSKSPSFYAGHLCISEAYLNEVVKRCTGFNVSYWIRERIVLEAQRLLRFTDKTVQQIAYALGYEDHIYFTRLFKRHTGMTPSEFRKNYHK